MSNYIDSLKESVIYYNDKIEESKNNLFLNFYDKFLISKGYERDIHNIIKQITQYEEFLLNHVDKFYHTTDNEKYDEVYKIYIEKSFKELINSKIDNIRDDKFENFLSIFGLKSVNQFIDFIYMNNNVVEMNLCFRILSDFKIVSYCKSVQSSIINILSDKNTDYEIIDKCLITIDNWENPEFINILTLINFEDDWLETFKKEVIKTLEEIKEK